MEAIHSMEVEEALNFEKVVQLICEYFSSPKRDLILYYLAKEQSIHGSRKQSGHWKIFSDLRRNSDCFKSYGYSFLKLKRNPEDVKKLADHGDKNKKYDNKSKKPPNDKYPTSPNTQLLFDNGL